MRTPNPKACPHGCGRRLSGVFMGKAEGKIPPQAREGSFRAQLDDDYCRYCSRAISTAAVEIEKTLARPSSADVYGTARLFVPANRRKPYKRKPVTS